VIQTILGVGVDAVERAFGADVDYGQIVKFYNAAPIGPGCYATAVQIAQSTITDGMTRLKQDGIEKVLQGDLTSRVRAARSVERAAPGI
jgi:hypothetical protein